MFKMILSMLAAMAVSIVASVAEAQQITHPVNDYANVLAPAEEEALAHQILTVEDESRIAGHPVQMALLLVNTTSGIPIDEYALRVAREWGGGTATLNDGLLIVFAMTDHKSDIEVGRGLENRITDVEATRALHAARSALQAGQNALAFRGVIADLGRLTGVPAGGAAAPTAPAPHVHSYAAPELEMDYTVPFVLVVFMLFVAGIVVYLRKRDAKEERLAREAEERAAEMREWNERHARERKAIADAMVSAPAPVKARTPEVTAPSVVAAKPADPPRPRGAVPLTNPIGEKIGTSHRADAYSPRKSSPVAASHVRAATPVRPRHRTPTPVPAYVPMVFEQPSNTSIFSTRYSSPVSDYSSPSVPDTTSTSTDSWTSSTDTPTSPSTDNNTDNGGGGGDFGGGGGSSDW